MGFFSFVKTAGRKIGLFGGQEAAAEEQRGQPLSEAERTAKWAQMAQQLAGAIEQHELGITDLAVSFARDTATLRGSAPSQAAREKAVLIVGNMAGVGGVDDQLAVESPEPPAVFHTVASGDTLSKISLAQYGVIRLYDTIFEANKPMLKHPDEIFPGQVLRIPPVETPVHTVKSGETLGGIAKWWYGNAKRYTDIFEANTDVLSDPNSIEVGQALKIPVNQPQAAAEA